MPEGDTILRAARTLDRALAGRPLVRFEAARLRYVPFAEGTAVVGAEARGKHCLLHFDDGRVLHTHMGMTGSWHLYRPGERWRRGRGGARAVVEVGARPGGEEAGEEAAGWVAVCFHAPRVALVDTAAAVPVGHLGPDLCRPDPDLDEAVRRLGEVSGPGRPVGDALLDQRIAAGVGNIYRCEACFARGVHPSTPVGALGPEGCRALLATAGELLRANLDRNRRATLEGGGVAVYGRSGRPCRRCGTPIAWAPLGEHRRSTWWCPTCQPEPGSG